MISFLNWIGLPFFLFCIPNFCSLRTISPWKVSFIMWKSAFSRTIPMPEFQKVATITTSVIWLRLCITAWSRLWISLALPSCLYSCPKANWHFKLYCNGMLNKAKTLQLGGISFMTAEPWLFHSYVILTKLVIFTHIRHVSHMSSVTTGLQL